MPRVGALARLSLCLSPAAGFRLHGGRGRPARCTDSVEASVLLLLWVQPLVSLETLCLRPGEGLVDRWVPDGPGGDCSHVVVRAYAPVMTSAAPECRDPFRDPRTYLASHRVSLPKSESIFPNKQEISFTCEKKRGGLSSVGCNLRCWWVTGFAGRAGGGTWGSPPTLPAVTRAPRLRGDSSPLLCLSRSPPGPSPEQEGA